ncbi:hypothetical protein BGZ98_001507 [Dissophora globulifera]|nr:hypothetical protein BGZ98_001507 [Dissophora globulifera]
MSPARIEHRHKLRKGLMDSLSNTENEQEVVASPMVNPFLEPRIGSSKKPLESAKESLERSLASRHDSLEAEVQDEEVDGLSKQELIILGRIRRMADTPLERIHQETEAKARQAPKLLDTILPYNKDYRRQRPVATTRDGNNDYAMHSGDSGSDADESEHATKDHRDRSKVSSIYRQSRFREKGQDGLQSSPERRRRTSRPELQEDLRTSRGGLQIRSQVTPQRHPRRHIPGRFSALDSDEEDEALRQHESDMQRRSQEPSIAGRLEHLDRYSGYKVRPQIYPTLQYGLRTKLYNPKLDDVLKWTSSALDHTPAASSKAPDHHKVTFAESVVSEVVSAAPAVLGALTAAAGLTGAVKAVKAVSNWDAAGFKMPDQSGKWTCPTCDVPNNDSLNKCACCDTSKPGAASTEKKAPALPSLFGPPSSSSTAPAETNKPPAAPFLFGAPPIAL